MKNVASEQPPNALVSVLFLGIPFLLICCFFLMTIVNGINAARLVGGHESTQATVIIGGMQREPSTYEFSIDGELYHGRSAGEKKGDFVDVAYIEANPKINRPADGLHKDMFFAAGVPLVMLLIFAYMYFSNPKHTTPQ